jgi:acyl carrier protein
MKVFDLGEFPYRLRTLEMPDCKMGEDVIFSEDNKTWYLTCMMSARVIVGSVADDRVERVIKILTPHAKDQAALSQASDATHILDDLKVNSARLVDVVLAFEDEFDLEIPDEDIDGVNTVGDCVTMIVEKAA